MFSDEQHSHASSNVRRKKNESTEAHWLKSKKNQMHHLRKEGKNKHTQCPSVMKLKTTLHLEQNISCMFRALPTKMIPGCVIVSCFLGGFFHSKVQSLLKIQGG